MNLSVLPEPALSKLAHVLADSTLSEEEKVIASLGIADDPILAQRARDWLPEAFAWHFISKMPDSKLPTNFHVKTRAGEWREFKLQVEPIFESARLLAERFYDEGPAGLFEGMVMRSALLAGLNNALNGGADIATATLSGPAFVALRAEVYEEPAT